MVERRERDRTGTNVRTKIIPWFIRNRRKRRYMCNMARELRDQRIPVMMSGPTTLTRSTSSLRRIQEDVPSLDRKQSAGSFALWATSLGRRRAPLFGPQARHNRAPRKSQSHKSKIRYAKRRGRQMRSDDQSIQHDEVGFNFHFQIVNRRRQKGLQRSKFRPTISTMQGASSNRTGQPSN